MDRADRQQKAWNKRLKEAKLRARPLATMPYASFLQTKHWKKLRERVLKRDKNACKTCGATEDLRVHHKTYRRRGHEKLRDLVTLCDTCHKLTHGRTPPDSPAPRTTRPPDHKVGYRDFRCADCGAMTKLDCRNCSSKKKTERDHCSECGSTFLEVVDTDIHRPWVRSHRYPKPIARVSEASRAAAGGTRAARC